MSRAKPESATQIEPNRSWVSPAGPTSSVRDGTGSALSGAECFLLIGHDLKDTLESEEGPQCLELIGTNQVCQNLDVVL